MGELLIPKPATPHPYFVIEWSAEKWELTLQTFNAFYEQGKECPSRLDKLEQPLSLNSCFWVCPDNSPLGYHLKAVDVKHYDKLMLNRLADASLSSAAPLLDWHYQQCSDPSGFMQHVRDMVTNDELSTLASNFPELEVERRNFEATLVWLETKKSIPTPSFSVNKPKGAEKRPLSNRACILMLNLLGVTDQIRGADANKQASVIGSLIDYNDKNTYNFLFREDTQFDPYSYKVVKDLYVYLDNMEMLMTPLGKKVETLWKETQAKRGEEV